MTRWLVVGLTLGIVVLMSCGGSARDLLPWEPGYESALARAGSENKPVMIDFYTDWCGWCKKLERETYTDVRVQEALSSFVLVKLNADREGRELAADMGVRGYPTLVFLNPQGREIGRIPGFMGPEAFLEELADLRGR
jgi:thiol:disulfide interchange protein